VPTGVSCSTCSARDLFFFSFFFFPFLWNTRFRGREGMHVWRIKKKENRAYFLTFMLMRLIPFDRLFHDVFLGHVVNWDHYNNNFLKFFNYQQVQAHFFFFFNFLISKRLSKNKIRQSTGSRIYCQYSLKLQIMSLPFINYQKISMFSDDKNTLHKIIY
jgi:hypothetical protein